MIHVYMHNTKNLLSRYFRYLIFEKLIMLEMSVIIFKNSPWTVMNFFLKQNIIIYECMIISQVAQIVGPLLANCGNRWQIVGWHANNEPTQAQQL